MSLTFCSVYNNYCCFLQVHLSPIIHTNFKPDTKKLSSNKRCAVSRTLSDHMLDTRTVPTGLSKSDLLSGLGFDSAIVYFLYSWCRTFTKPNRSPTSVFQLTASCARLHFHMPNLTAIGFTDLLYQSKIEPTNALTPSGHYIPPV